MNLRMTSRLATLVVVAACAAEGHAQPIRQFDQQTVERLGRELYQHDIAAWRATDSLMHSNKAGQLADPEMAKIKGWIVVGPEGGLVVKFIGEGPDGPYPVYVAAFYTDEQRARSAAPPTRAPLTDAERARFRARQAAASQALSLRCAERYNTVVLDNPEGEGFLVYLLAASAKPRQMVVGGHHRVTVSADGNRIIRSEPLSRSCLTVETGPLPGTNEPAKIMVTHVVSLAPIETHVFLNYLHRTDLYVTTDDAALWLVSRGKVQLSTRNVLRP
jgi:hypothetical protein